MIPSRVLGSADVVSAGVQVTAGRTPPDSGPWRALHRLGLSVTVTTVGRHGSSGPPAAHDAYRFTGVHPPAAAKTVRAATQHNSLLLSKEER